MKEKIKDKKTLIIAIATISLIFIIIKLIDINYQKENTNNTQENHLPIAADENTQETDEEKIVVYITGEVVNQGVIELKYGSRISDAIEKAGGLTQSANINNVNLAYKLEDGQKIYIPNINEEETEIIKDEEDGAIGSGKTEEVININKATQVELQKLQGIGESLSKSIIDYREENGRFKTVEEIMNVPGIGESKFNNIKEQIKVR